MKPHFIPDQAGELIVVNKNKVEVVLRNRQPSEIFVKFKCHMTTVPCNPQHFDELEWELHYKHHRYVLLIKWRVSEVRDIVWAVKY